MHALSQKKLHCMLSFQTQFDLRPKLTEIESDTEDLFQTQFKNELFTAVT